MDSFKSLVRRQGYQSQNLSDGGLIDYWGYAVRVWPCTNDPGTCEYFEAVYGGHETGMLYSGILVATLGGLLLLFTIVRHFCSPPRASEALEVSILDSNIEEKSNQSSISRVFRTVAAAKRQAFLPESLRLVFGRTTRLQVTILACLTGYLTIFSFAGITYQIWRTPVKGYDNLYQTRSGLGPWSDRVGVLAYALTPFSVLLASRESILSQLTGIPYQSFNFLHRWLGYIIFVQSLLHTIGWTLIETVFYQPQPQVANKWIKQEYMIWGCVAMILILMLFILSLPWTIRRTGYEFFRKSHYVLAMVYIGACWGHWKPLKAFMIPALSLWFFDRLARLARMAMIHYQYLPSGTLGFVASKAKTTVFPDSLGGDIVRMDIKQPQQPWKIGQHFYLCFPTLSVWQSHPFTPFSLPVKDDMGHIQHSYLIRARKGLTARLSTLSQDVSTPVIMQGAYGENLVEHLTPDVNILAIAGGTGITYVLPVLLWIASRRPVAHRTIALIWAVRHSVNVEWIAPELDQLLTVAKSHGIEIRVHATRDDLESSEKKVLTSVRPLDNYTVAQSDASSSSSRDTIPLTHKLGRPRLTEDIVRFVEGTVRGRTEVIASGPASLISELRSTVATLNRPSEVWRGQERFDVNLKCDDRLEW